MWIYGPGTEAPVCTHTSSIVGEGTDSSWIELGWVSAPNGVVISDDSSPDHPTNKCVNSGGDGTPAQGDGKPKLFRSTSLDRGDDWKCTVFYDIASADWDGYKSFSVYDTDPSSGNWIWETKYAGSSIGGTATMNYSSSYSMTNAERYTPSTAAWPTGESADAKFDHLQYFSFGSTWLDWTSIACGPFTGLDSDPTYKVKDWTSDPTSVHVSTSGTFC